MTQQEKDMQLKQEKLAYQAAKKSYEDTRATLVSQRDELNRQLEKLSSQWHDYKLIHRQYWQMLIAQPVEEGNWWKKMKRALHNWVATNDDTELRRIEAAVRPKEQEVEPTNEQEQ